MTRPSHGIEWLPGDPVPATCPACAGTRAKPRVLRVDTLGPESRPIVLVRCSACELLFFRDLGEPLGFEAAAPRAVDEHFELGVGLRGSVECFARIDRARVRSLLEVGCGTGLALDWARHVEGWRVLGVDSSAMSARAARELALPIAGELLGEGEGFEPGTWDLVFACEVIEHVTDPAGFLTAVRRALAPGGVFLLRTPAGEGLRPDREEIRLVATLSPGFHTMIHTAASLERLLRAAGFGVVRIVRDGDTLHAAAAESVLEWDPDATLPAEDVTRYLDERADTLPVDSAARQGLLQQLANEAVNAGDLPLARRALARLDATLRARHGLGLGVGAAEIPDASAAVFASAFVAAALEAAASGNRPRALDRFLAAAAASRAASAVMSRVNAFHEGAEETRAIAERQALVLAAAEDPGTATRLLRDLPAGAARDAGMLELFTQAVGRGSFDFALTLAPGVEPLLAGGAAQDDLRREARWALAMLLLHAAGRPGDAAEHFARAAAEAADDARRCAARFHEGYARWHAGDVSRAEPILRGTVAAALTPGSPAAEWAGQAAGLLAAGAHAG